MRNKTIGSKVISDSRLVIISQKSPLTSKPRRPFLLTVFTSEFQVFLKKFTIFSFCVRKIVTVILLNCGVRYSSQTC